MKCLIVKADIVTVVDLTLYFTPDPTFGWSQVHDLYSAGDTMSLRAQADVMWWSVGGWDEPAEIQVLSFFQGSCGGPLDTVTDKYKLRDTYVGSNSDLFLSLTSFHKF